MWLYAHAAVEELVVRFERIIASNYYTIIPQIRPSRRAAEQSVPGPEAFHTRLPCPPCPHRTLPSSLPTTPLAPRVAHLLSTQSSSCSTSGLIR